MNIEQIQKEKEFSVFIVDDSEIVRERLTSMLSEIGSLNIVGFADNPADAMEAILRLKPNVIILDIFLNGGSGITVLRNVRAKKIQSKIIMLTNYAQEQYRKKCFEEGADYFFDKSIEFDKIIDVIQRFSIAV
jgi:DNA-binding NarL/FixJ family response regulator